MPILCLATFDEDDDDDGDNGDDDNRDGDDIFFNTRLRFSYKSRGSHVYF